VWPAPLGRNVLAMVEDSGRPSKVVTYFAAHLQPLLPAAAATTLASYESRIELTTTLGDFHRCVHCAEWANDLKATPGDAHLRHVLRDVVSWRNCLGAVRPGKKISDVELGWVDDAVKTAATVASTAGWGAVPWEMLLTDLIALDGLALDDASNDPQIPPGWTCLLGQLSPGSAAMCAEILGSHGVVVTKRTNPRSSGWNDRVYPEELLVRDEDAQRAHDVLAQWSQGEPASPS
jgi:hypothetical protein